MKLDIKRPRGLVPGSIDWFKESVGPKLLQRIDEEIAAQPVGSMTPTGARLLSVGLSIVYPTVSAVHHTVEGSLSQLSEQDLKKRFAELMEAHNQAKVLQQIEGAEIVEYQEVKE